MNKCACGTLNTKDFQKDEKFANDRFTVTKERPHLTMKKKSVIVATSYERGEGE